MPNLYTHFAGLVVRTFPNKTDSIQSAIKARGIDISGADEEGRIVLVIEAQSEKVLADEMNALTEIEGVISVSLAYHEIEKTSDLDKPLDSSLLAKA